MTTPLVIPTNLHLPFAASGSKNTIPVAGISPNAGYDTGFPPATMMPIAAGGTPPEGKDFNGILYDITSHTLWVNAGGQYKFDAALSTYIGGYPIGMVLQSNDGLSSYVSAVNNNTTDFNSTPSSIGTSWLPWAGNSKPNFEYAADSGAANAYVVTLSPALTTHITGLPINFKAANANTGASTVNINGLGAIAIKKNVSAALDAGDIAAGQIVTIVYDGTYYQLINNGQAVDLSQFAKSHAATGYQKSANGFIQQWGVTAIAGGSGGFTLTLPIAFPNNCLFACANSVKDNSASVILDKNTTTVSGTGTDSIANINLPDSTLVYVYAIGY